MDMGSQTAYLASRLTIILVTVVGLIVAFSLGISVSEADYMPVMLLLMVITTAAWVLVSGSNYWILIPLAFSLQIPALPLGPRAFELPELAAAGCFGLFCARMAFKVQPFNLFRIDYLWIGAYFIWVIFVYTKNPTGLLIFGASSGGARSYAKIILAFLSFLVMSNQKLSEKECKWIVWLMLAGSLGTGLVYARDALMGLDETSNFGELEEGGWQQSFIGPLMIWLSYLLGRFRMDQIFSLARFYLVPFMVFLYYAALLTGKRAVFAVMVAMPLFVAVLRRQWNYVVVGCIGSILVVSTLVVGHGKLFQLPYRAQRAMAYLPGDWDPRLRRISGDNGELDVFRARMNEKALEQIKESPWLGPGYQLNVQEFQRIMVTSTGNSFNAETQIEMLAKGSAWHNQWLGIAADFGIPAAIVWGLYYIQVVLLGLWLFKRIPFGTHRHTLLIMIGLFYFSQIGTSWSGGHSALSVFAQWWMFGILISMRQSVREEIRAKENNVAVAPEMKTIGASG